MERKHPEWHIQDDVLNYISQPFIFFHDHVWFRTQDGNRHEISSWDMILAFPPCTHLAGSGATWFKQKRDDGRQRTAIEFFCEFLNAKAPYIAIENPVGIMSGDYVATWYPELCHKYGLPIKYNQIIHPYQFGHPVSKKTCLWLKGLPGLVPTDIVTPERKGNGYSGNLYYATKDGKALRYNDPLTAKIRSKTYPGIAKAMATQWCLYVFQVEKLGRKIENPEWKLEEW